MMPTKVAACSGATRPKSVGECPGEDHIVAQTHHLLVGNLSGQSSAPGHPGLGHHPLDAPSSGVHCLLVLVAYEAQISLKDWKNCTRWGDRMATVEVIVTGPPILPGNKIGR